MDAFAHALLIWALELLLSRFTGETRQLWLEITISWVGALLIVLVPAGLLRVLQGVLPEGLLWAAHSAVGVVTAALVALGISGPVLHERGAAPFLGGTVATVGLLALAAFHRREVSPYPSPFWLLAIMGLTVSVSWWLNAGTLAPPLMAATVGGSWLLVGVLVALGLGTRRRAHRILIAICCVVLTTGLARLPTTAVSIHWRSQSSPLEALPDVILFTVDTLRADAAAEMQAYKRLAEGGATFAAVQAPSPWTLPSIATILTGTFPSRHGAGRLERGTSALVTDVATLAESLSRAGYDTAAVTAANPFVGPSFGLHRGFAYFYQPGWSRHALPRGRTNLVARPLLPRLYLKVLGGPAIFVDGLAVSEVALNVIEERRAERPLFLWLHYLDTHLPYMHTSDPKVSQEVRRAVRRGRVSSLESFRSDSRLRSQLWAAYMDEVRFVDRSVLKILDGLGPPLSGGRIVVLTSDHGEEFFEHGQLEHGHALYQEVINVPLVIAGIQGLTGARVEPVSLADVGPTLGGAVGFDTAHMHGVDLRTPLPERVLPSGNMLYGGAPDWAFSARKGRWKAIYREDVGAALYDLKQDPLETMDLALKHPSLVTDLLAGHPKPLPRGDDAVEIDDTTREMLKNLGYAHE